MKNRFFYWTPSATFRAGFILIAVLSASACVPATPASTGAAETVVAAPTEVIIASDTPTPTFIPSVGATAIPSSPVPTVQAIPTSRGPNLEATDPATVSLASGGLQLVEFFRFT